MFVLVFLVVVFFLNQLLKVQRLDCLHCPTPNSCEAASAPLLLHKFISLCFWLACASSPSASLASLRLWPCTSKSGFCLPLQAAYICLLSVETKETDHKAYYGARSGACARVCVCVCFATLLLPLLVWCWSHGFQASSSVNQNQTFIFNRFKSSTWSPWLAELTEVPGDYLFFSLPCVFIITNMTVLVSCLHELSAWVLCGVNSDLLVQMVQTSF